MRYFASWRLCEKPRTISHRSRVCAFGVGGFVRGGEDERAAGGQNDGALDEMQWRAACVSIARIPLPGVVPNTFVQLSQTLTAWFLRSKQYLMDVSESKRPARRMMIRSPSSSHSNIDPGPMPSLLRTSDGIETLPCEVTLERAIAMTHIARVMKPYSRAKPTPVSTMPSARLSPGAVKVWSTRISALVP